VNVPSSFRVLVGRHRADDSVSKAIGRVLRADLVVVDDIGLLPVAQDAAEGLYRLVDAAYEKRSIAVSSNLHPAAFDELMPKTLATDLLTAPTARLERVWTATAQPTLRESCLAIWLGAVAAAVTSSSIWGGVAMRARDDTAGNDSRDVTMLTVASLGRVEGSTALPGMALVDAPASRCRRSATT
jgi:hypothetical protein